MLMKPVSTAIYAGNMQERHAGNWSMVSFMDENFSVAVLLLPKWGMRLLPH